MKTHSIQLEKDDTQQVQQIERSIIHYSIELGKIAVVEHNIRNSLVGLGEARHKLIQSILKNNGFDLNKVAGVQVNPEIGSIIVEIDESKSESAPNGPVGAGPVSDPVGKNGPAGHSPTE